MNLIFHNRIDITINNKTHHFYNTMLKSVKDKLKNLESFFNYLSVGTGSGLSATDNFKLTGYVSSYNLETEFSQTNPKSNMFITKSTVIGDNSLDGKYITEAGISAEIDENPTIFNYFSLKNADFPNGILKEIGEEIAISVTIYLQITNTSNCLLTAGNNPFVNFLLGNGIDKNSIHAARGKNLTENTLVNRESFDSENKFPCEFNFLEEEDSLKLEFIFNMLSGSIYEVVLFANTLPFARINAVGIRPTTSQSTIVSSSAHNNFKLGEDVKSITEIKNHVTGTIEENTDIIKYAESFGDKISLPFNNRFSYMTSRFTSKEGNKIFFVVDDIVYGYENKDFEVTELKLQSINYKNISKVVAFNKFLFVITKSSPYIYCLYKTDDIYELFEIDFADVENSRLIEQIYDADLTMGQNGVIMLGMIDNENHFAYTFYFNADIQSKKITLDEVKTSNFDYDYHYVLSMYKNSFCDSMIIFLRNGISSVSTRIIYFYADKTIRDKSNTLAQEILKDAKELYVKNRAIIVEKTTHPSLWLYYYPEIEPFQLSNSGTEQDNYISTNLQYLIKKYNRNNYEIFTLADIDNPTLFAENFPNEISQSKILDFEFLDDSLLIFINDENEPIIAYNLFQNGVSVQNTTDAEAEYEVKYEKYNLLGSGNEEVTVKFTVEIEI